MRKFLSHWPYLLALSLITIFLTRYFWGTRAWIETHDGIFHVIRLEVFVDALKHGQFPVRWAGSLDNGFGLPLFNYVYPAPYYLGTPLFLLGLSSKWVIKIISVGFYLLGGLGVYLTFAKSRLRALFAATIFLTTPYLMLNLFVRGALGEFIAICLLPWVILSTNDLIKKGKLSWFHPLPYFFLFLSHNFLSFLFLPIYLLILFRNSRKSRILGLVNLFLSVVLAAFFLIPMVLERTLVYAGSGGNFTYNYADHFLYPLQLLWSRWGNGHSVVGIGDGISFQLGIANLLLIGLSLYWGFRHRKSSDLKFWLIIAFGSILLLLPIALPIWKLFSPLQVIQFPWRLLALTTICAPMIAYYSISLLSKTKMQRNIMIALAVISIFFAYFFSTPPYLQNNEQFATQMYIHRDQTTTSSRLELIPRWAPLKERWKKVEEIHIASGNAELQLTHNDPYRLSLISTTTDPDTSFAIKRNYFPSWKVQDETGKTLKLDVSSEGDLLFSPELGTHTYNIYVGSTLVETISNWLSIFGLIIIICLAIRPQCLNKIIIKRFLTNKSKS